MTPGNMYPSQGADAYYLRCLDAVGSSPLNDRRIQFYSQESTMDIDPSLPRMNVTDWKTCLRKHFNLFPLKNKTHEGSEWVTNFSDE